MNASTTPAHVLHAITEAYIADLKHGNLPSALGRMTGLADAYGLPAVRDLAGELVCALHTRCPARFRNSLGCADTLALAPARTADPLTLIDVAARTNRMMGRGRVTSSDLAHAELQMNITEDVRRTVQSALNTATQGPASVIAHLAALTTPQQLSAAVTLLTTSLVTVL